MDVWGGELESLDETPVHIAGRHPFRSAPVEELAREGFVRRADEGGSTTVRTPTFFSRTRFLDAHCFRYGGPAAAESTLVGLSFEPLRSGNVSEIRGTLWLDGRGSGLRSVEFEYRGASPLDRTRRRAHGRVEFDRLPSGAWIIRKWWIRIPSGARRYGVRKVDVSYEEGGRITDAYPLVSRFDADDSVPSVYDLPVPLPGDSAGGSPR